MTWLHRFTQVVVGATFLLVVAGGLVTSTGSGLSVPDWPTSYGWSMFTFPYSRWVGGIRYEHVHRLIATTVGLLAIIMVIAYGRAEPRKWVRRLTLVALGAIVAQGLLGGLTVLAKLPPAVSSAHAGLAEIVFVLTVSFAVFTSRGWATAYEPAGRLAESTSPLARDVGLRCLSIAAICAVYLQIVLGAVMRHTGAGLAIPDFPLMFGRLLPPTALFAVPGVAVHFAHRLGALVVAACLVATAWRVFARHGDRRELARPALLLLVLLVLQVTLGGLTVLTGKDVVVNTAHLAVGALIFATTVVLALRVHRPHFAAGVLLATSSPHPAPGMSASTAMRERNAES
jgi:cytochrome c oxidase assembly protein subunit 15